MKHPSRLGDETHHWMQRGHFEACKVCGIVRRADRKNKPCPGPVKIKLREFTGDGSNGE